MSSRFKVQKVSESDGNEALHAADDKDDKVPLNPPDSGSSTPDTSNSDEREIRSLLGKSQEGETTETPPPYSDKSEDPDKELPASSASCNLDEPEPQAQAAGDASKEPKSRFHVEFVDAKDGNEGSAQSPPTSPTHDSVNNSMTNNTHSKTYYMRTFGHNTQEAIGLSICIVLLSAVVTVITTLSMSAICTNGQVRGGGAYYLISRSLGPEFGGAIGLIFSLANAVGVALYVVGFAETVVYIIYENGAQITGDKTNDIRIIGAATVLLLLGITQLGMAWEAKTQLVLLFILIVAIINFIVGTFIPADVQDNANGFFNYQGTIIAENIGPDFHDGNGFFSVFSIFFPAATGILAGSNISGDLKDASKAIPKGTLLAILISTIVYCVIAVMLGSVELRGASGNVTDCYIGVNGSEVANCTSAACQFGWDYQMVPCKENPSEMCYSDGLLYDTQVMGKISGFGPIITAGIFAATLSSALASLVSAPKIFQAVCKDKIFPGIGFFGKGAPGSDEPRRAYLLAFVISLGFTLIGELNNIADIISNFFLASYALINYSCFAASLSRSPGWRPSFKYYNMWLSLVGAAICVTIMFVINWYAALITIVIILALYKFVDYKKPDVNWGSSTQAYLYVQALNSALKLQSVEDHVKNFRPQTLVLSGPPSHRPAIVHFASQFTKNAALMCCANVVEPKGKNSYKAFIKERVQAERWLKQQKVKSFYDSVVCHDLKQGIASLMQSVGIGKLRTNTVLMGFKRDWREDTTENLMGYIAIIHDAFDLNYGVCILRLKEGLDVSPYLQDTQVAR